MQIADYSQLPGGVPILRKRRLSSELAWDGDEVGQFGWGAHGRIVSMPGTIGIVKYLRMIEVKTLVDALHLCTSRYIC